MINRSHISDILCCLFLVLLLVACGTPSKPVTASGGDMEVPPSSTSTHAHPSPTSISPTPSPIPPMPTHTHQPEAIVYLNPQRYFVEYIVRVSNDGFDLNELQLYQPRPVEWDAQTDVEIEEISPTPSEEGEDPDHGNGMYLWKIMGDPKPGKSTTFTLRFTFTAYETRTNISPEDIQPYDRSNPLYAMYTRPERFIEVSDPEIVALADQVVGAETNPYLIARSFYDYVVDTAQYKLLGEGLAGAKSLCTGGTGECGDYSALFVALCRAKGIPARPIVGYWAINGIDQTHVWAEFYVEPFGWVPVDPTIGQFEPGKRDYYFGNMDNQRVILNKGYNITLDPPGPDNFIASFLQVPLWWFWGSGDSDAMSIERTRWRVEIAD
ncbi:MAG TPA: transglutaminase domain-containing protein [Anaerolineae bacterium]|nr:transglutaminase domain-containing protein [Anaerolineae bacterium]